MQAEFWHAMWGSGKVGFHQDEINPYLKSYWQALGLAKQAAVFVPLCGKSMDMLWLAQLGHSVLGVELSQKALDELIAEHNLPAKPIQHENFCGYNMDSMMLLCGDFFHLSEQEVVNVQGVYDRAALVALPPQMRVDYVTHLQAILPVGHQILLVVMEYDPSQMDGPPFSVSEAEVQQLYGANYQIKLLETFDLIRKGHSVIERVYHLTHQA